MRRWVICVILFAPLIWYFVKSEPGISLVNQDSLLSSLVPPSSLLLNDETTFLGGDEFIVVNLDGTIFYGSHKTGEAKWAFSSGARTHASYQNVPYLSSSTAHDPFFIDTDGKGLYYYSRKGKEKLPYSIGQYVGMVPLVSPVGGVTTGSKNTSVFLVDPVSGKILSTFMAGDTRSPTLGAEQRSLAEDLEIYEQVLYIMRTDYKLQHFTPNGKLVWELETAEVDAKVLCLKNATVLGLEDGLDSKSFYHKKLNVFQLDRNSQGRLPTLNAPHHNLPELYFGKGALPPPNNEGREMFVSSSIEALALPDAYFGDRPRHNLLAPSYGKGALPPSNSEGREMLGSSLALPSMNSPITNDESPMKSLFLIIFSLLFMMGGFIFYYLTFRKQPKAKPVAEETKMQTWVPKKKKTRRLGNNKKSSSYEKDASNILDHYKVGESAGSERSEPKLPFPSSDLVDRVGRRIGKLLVSNNIIAKGSNGTIVLEGIYDGRPVAVKRLVRSHHDVALKEIQNLIASDQHPNIVRWYGVEHDQDFVYLSLERCSCSLNDLIYFHSESFENHKGEDPGFLTESHIQLWKTIMGNNKDVELWKTNGYPSPQLLKLMSDLVSGLAHLHELGIIHRDLKPQNVLIIKGRSLCAKLSDMGISKQLQGDRSSITQHATGYGSSGWQAPEQLQHQRQTRAVDLFSLGCLLFFCVSGGKHPYGDSIERDVNIVNDRKDLFLVQNMPEAVDLFTRLLDPNPDVRPTAVDVLHHPFFWSSETRLSFLRDASDRVELEDRETASQLLSSLESTAAVALNGKWDEKMEPAFLNNIGRYRRYNFYSIRDLLRVIRNKLNHYRELPTDIQILLGTVPEGFDSYFSSRFPKLLIQVYKVLYKFCKEEEFFRKYIKGSPALTA